MLVYQSVYTLSKYLFGEARLGKKDEHRENHSQLQDYNEKMVVEEPTQFEKICTSQIGSFSQGSGWEFQTYLSCHHLIS